MLRHLSHGSLGAFARSVSAATPCAAGSDSLQLGVAQVLVDGGGMKPKNCWMDKR
jgi:hypothetical protein